MTRALRQTYNQTAMLARLVAKVGWPGSSRTVGEKSQHQTHGKKPSELNKLINCLHPCRCRARFRIAGSRRADHGGFPLEPPRMLAPASELVPTRVRLVLVRPPPALARLYDQRPGYPPAACAGRTEGTAPPRRPPRCSFPGGHGGPSLPAAVHHPPPLSGRWARWEVHRLHRTSIGYPLQNRF